MAQRCAIDQMCTVWAVVHDLRRQHPTKQDPLDTILTITILATICGAQYREGCRSIQPYREQRPGKLM